MSVRFDLALCTMVKGENPYLPEWIAYHTAVGVDHFFVYDNGSPVPLSETLAPEIRRGVATVVPIAGRFMQMTAFNDGLKRFGGVTRWMGFVDIDEFLFPKRHRSLKDLLSGQGETGGLAVNWQMFGSSGHATRPQGLQIENFVMRAETEHGQNRHVKCVVRPEAVERVGSAHHCVYRPGHGCVNEKEEPVHGGHSNVSVDVVQINHYYTRSRAEYGEKLVRGRVDFDIPMAFTFDQIDPSLNAVKDESILAFAPAVRTYLETRA